MLPLLGSLLLIAAEGPSLPRGADVRAAIEDELNGLCGGALESETCVSHPATVDVRRLVCRPAGEGMASCRYARRIDSALSGRSRWRAAETVFRFDGEARLWRVAEDRDAVAIQN